jgi:hypothetical protein
MSLIIEEMGLAEPDRYTWTLHDRLHVGTIACPVGMEYTVIMRNFDPATTEPTAYVNGTRYGYEIFEACQGTPFLADAVEFPVDPLADTFTAVASWGFLGVGTATFSFGTSGFYYTGLTRDDVGGLRYLLKTNNMNTETAGPGTLAFTTNRTPQLLYTSNLTDLATAAVTNDAATLQALFPGVVVADSSVYFTNVWVATLSSYLTNYPFDPAGTPPHTVFVTNYTLVAETRYNHTFANVYSVQRTPTNFNLVRITDPRYWTSSTYVTVQTTTVKPSPYAPAGSGILVTNTASTTYNTSAVVGEYFLLPAGACDVAILYPQITNFVSATNILSISTNATESLSSLPMTKAPPGRFSMMIDWPSSFDSSCARMRAPLSVALPGACGTTSFMARSGYCACADVAKAAAHVRLTNKSCIMRIAFSLACGFGFGSTIAKINASPLSEVRRR